MIKSTIYFFGTFFYYLYPYCMQKKIHRFMRVLNSGRLSRMFASVGTNSIFSLGTTIVGGKYIRLGKDCFFGKKTEITAFCEYNGKKHQPQIVIADGFSMNDYGHITCCNNIVIGNNVKTGKFVLITDNSHGASCGEDINIIPEKRFLYSKGPVVIDDNVWIGDKVTICPGVHIGEGCIIGANAVVVNDIPAFSVAAGIPAKVVKKIK